MRIEEEIFARKRIVTEKLKPFGFVKQDGKFFYSEEFLEGDFRAEVTVDEKGALSGRVIDVPAGEEYLPVHFEERVGAFVGTVRLSYSEILQRIALACSVDELFRWPQTNRIASKIFEKYGEKPDFPFSTAPSFGVFRYGKNRKWYGLVMDIPGKLVTGDPADKDIADVLNLKAGEDNFESTVSRQGIYEAYHMKKKSWVSVILDGTVPDEEIMDLLDRSRSFAVSSRKSPKGFWIVPANPRYYDVDAAFAENEEILWKQGRGIRTGDTVFLYVAAPASEIRYRCIVTESNIPYAYEDENISIKEVMKIKLIRKYSPGQYKFSRLKELGISFVRGPLPATDDFLREVEMDF